MVARTSPEIEVWLDGHRVPPDQAHVSVLDRGFLYGDSVFETLRTYDKWPFALAQHLARLSESASRVYIELPKSRAELEHELRRAVAESAHAECYVRVMITRGTGPLGLDPSDARNPLVVYLVGPLAPPSLAVRERGIDVVTFATARVTELSGTAGAKVGNYLTAVVAGRRAKEHGAAEALIVGSEGRVLEGATSNLFWCSEGRLETPPESAGILAGITRHHLLEVARELGIEVRYRCVTPTELVQMDEVFVSSSIREVLGVVSIDGQPVGHGAVGELTRRLYASFHERAVSLSRHDAERFSSAV